jgi:hypothetical protein
MKNLRRWQGSSQVGTFTLAADARLSRTNYADDQAWDLRLGKGDSPALALQTTYGMRAGLVSLVPIWTQTQDGHSIYQAQTYHQAPQMVHFAPNYVEIEAQLLPDVVLSAYYWALESRAVGGVYSLQNNSNAPLSLRFEIFGHVVLDGAEQSLGLISMRTGGNALYLGDIRTISPVVMVQDGSTRAEAGLSPRVGRDLKLEPGEKATVRWVHTGLGDMRQSLNLARRWLATDWQPHLQQINDAALSLPTLQTGDKDQDFALDWSYNQIVQSIVRPAGNFPRHTYVSQRFSGVGFSPRADGSKHLRSWSGQDPFVLYSIAPVLATIAPEIAQGFIENYIAVQQQDGWIDLKPGAAGQRADLLCTPLLATISLKIYDVTQDADWLKRVFPPMLRFFVRWLGKDLDADNDGFPEWQDERQQGYVTFPTFGTSFNWAQGADVRTVEGPDMAAYLLSEVYSLQQMATVLGEEAEQKQLQGYIDALQEELATLWDGTRYAYRDRDTDVTTSGMVLLEGGVGDQEHVLKQPFVVPNRVILRVIGGARHVPRVTAYVKGLDADGNAISATIEPDDFRWQYREGVATTQQVFSQVDSIHCEGLSRVYKIDAHTVDTTGLDVNALLPLWALTYSDVDADKAASLIKLATDSEHFYRNNGITMVSAKDKDKNNEGRFDPANENGAGGLWPFWSALVAEGLARNGAGDKAADVLKNMLKMQADVLEREGRFFSFYHADKATGLGERHHLSGIVPVSLLMQLVGIQVRSPGEVVYGAAFHWGRAITIRQHGVYVRRTRNSTKIKFPSGHTVELDANAATQTLTDPQPLPKPTLVPLELPEIQQPAPSKPATSSPQRVIIEVEHED